MSELYDVRVPVSLRVEADSAEEAQDIITEALQTLVDSHAKQRRLSQSQMVVEGVFDIKGRGIVVVTDKPPGFAMDNAVITIENAGTWRVNSVEGQARNIRNNKPERVGLWVKRVIGHGDIAIGASIKVGS